MGETPNGPIGPSHHHERLMQKIGDWNVACTYFLGTDPISAKGTDKLEALGPFWTVGRFRCDVMGNEIHGMATTGYDPSRGKYVGTWQDSSTPYLYMFEGDFDDDGRLVMEGENVDPVRGELATYRSVETLGADERRLELFIVIDEDSVMQVLDYTYTRA